MQTAKIRIEPIREKAIALPLGRLSSDEFRLYLEATRANGFAFSRTDGGQVGAVSRVASLAAALDRVGLYATVAASLVERVREDVERATSRLSSADERLDRTDAALAARGLRLFPYQRIGVRALAPRRGFLLADQMGLGKTVQALIALPDRARAVVVAPAAVKGVWRSEAARWRPDLRVSVLSGRGSFRYPEPGEIVVTNYDVLPEASDGRPSVPVLPVEPPSGVVLVADEAHAVKSSKALRTRRLRALSRVIRKAGGSAWLLTGTPLLNRPPELYSVLEAAGIAEEAFGSFKRFFYLFNATTGRFGTEWGSPRPEVPELLRKVSLQRRREAVLPDLPTKVYRTVPTNGLDEALVRRLDEVVESLSAIGIDLAAATSAAEIAQRAGRVLFEQMSAVRASLATAKIPALLALVEEYEAADEPLVVFSAHRGPVDALASRPGWASITGDTSAEERTRIVADFQAGRLCGLSATIQAGGTGITLTRSSHVVFVDLAWTPALNEQAEDRVCRIGQSRGVVVTRLVAGHVLDERVSELLSAKEGLIEAAVERSARTEADPEVPSLPTGLVVHADGTDFEEARKKAEAEERERSEKGPQAPQDRRYREAETEAERWASRGLLVVAGLDADFAAVRNDVGFSRFDGEVGHDLADRIAAGRTFSEKQWGLILRLARKYRKQISAALGPEPGTEEKPKRARKPKAEDSTPEDRSKASASLYAGLGGRIL
jgi:SWI/SNF-related matrix-associated actin-dependent regulator 1 of chromatin subfamily A